MTADLLYLRSSSTTPKKSYVKKGAMGRPDCWNGSGGVTEKIEARQEHFKQELMYAGNLFDDDDIRCGLYRD